MKLLYVPSLYLLSCTNYMYMYLIQYKYSLHMCVIYISSIKIILILYMCMYIGRSKKTWKRGSSSSTGSSVPYFKSLVSHYALVK